MIRELVLAMALALAATTAQAQWHYTKVPDEMRSTTSLLARLHSLNTQDVGSISTAGSRLTMFVWLHPFRPETEGRHDIGLALGRGIFSCHNNDVCPVFLKVDEGAVEEFVGELAEDYSVMWLSGNGQARILDAIAKNKRLIVEVPVFQHGARQFRFSLTPLRWPR